MSTNSITIRVYLVEDEHLLRQSLVAMLELEDDIQIVGSSDSAEEAIPQISVLNVDAILMDLHLPGMSGIDAIRIIRDKHPEVKVIALSSFGGRFVGDAMSAGASGYMLKTCNRKQLVAAIDSAIAGNMPLDPSLTKGLVRELAEHRANQESKLTDRQKDILRLVAKGNRYKEIADLHYISESTVTREMRLIYKRLQVKDAPHAIAQAYKLSLI